MSEAREARQIEAEIREFHAFLTDWLNGTLPHSDLGFQRCRAAAATDLTFVSRTGQYFRGGALLDELQDAHGVHAGEDFRIRVDNIRHGKPDGALRVAVFDEWHESDSGSTGRIVSAWLRADSGAPNGYLWQHVHETWLPGQAPDT